MKWNEALYILNSQILIIPDEIKVLSKLPTIRDEIFFPEYKNFRYNAQDFELSVSDVPSKIFILDFPIKSLNANRKLFLSFRFSVVQGIYDGYISDTIWMLNHKNDWGNHIDMDILIQKRTGKPPEFDYWRLSSYPGFLEEKIRACLKQTKYNYDTYVADIINGTNWDGTANDHSYI